MKKILMIMIIMMVMVMPAQATPFCNTGKFMDIGMFGGWLYCDKELLGDKCAPVDQFWGRLGISRGDIDLMIIALDTIGRNNTPAHKSTYDDISFREFDRFTGGYVCK